jgi:ABC-type multidrug transport system permease subunit
VEEGLRIGVDAAFYAHRLVGDDLREFASGPPSGNTFPDERIAEFSVKINRIVERVSESLSPLLIELEVASVKEEEEEAEPTVSVALLFVPSILFMSLVMMAQGLSADLWQEREARTLRRVVVSPRRITVFLAGKLLAAATVMTAVCLVTLAIAYAWFSIPLGTLPFALVWAVFSGAMMTVLMMVLQLFSSSQRAGGIVTMGLMFPLLMVGGSFFPFEAMPEGMAAIGRLTPNGWALTQLKAILLQRVVPSELAIAFALLLGVGSALFWIGARRLRAGFAQG